MIGTCRKPYNKFTSCGADMIARRYGAMMESDQRTTQMQAYTGPGHSSGNLVFYTVSSLCAEPAGMD